MTFPDVIFQGLVMLPAEKVSDYKILEIAKNWLHRVLFAAEHEYVILR